MRLTRTYEAEAAHQLSAGVPPGHPCRRLHGHRYEITVTLYGDVDPSTGMLMEYAEIDRRVREVLDLVDHRFLNLLGDEVAVVPMVGTWLVSATPIKDARILEPALAAKVRENSTVEHLRDWFAAELLHRFPRLNRQVGLDSVEIREDSRSTVA